MRYTAEALQDENDDTGYSPAVVAPTGPSEALAVRHARAMAAVLRASRAYATARNSGDGERERAMDANLRRAVARLEKVEKEVSR